MNNRFLEQYKRADSICRDIYNSDSGITNYINLMRDAKNYKMQDIDEWDDVLKRLMSLRHIRNKLTHDIGTLDMELCTEDDVLWLESFCQSLLDTSDPLAKHYRAFYAKEKTKKKSKAKKSDEPVFKTAPISKKRRKVPPMLRALGFLALLIILFYLLVQLYKYLGI